MAEKQMSQELRKLLRSFQSTLCGNAKAQKRVVAINTLLNSSLNLKLLNETELETIWESIFYALWFAEMGRGCEEIIAAVERACTQNVKLAESGIRIIAKKWYGLDQYRIDKTSHLARHLLSVVIRYQIRLWFKHYAKQKNLGTSDLTCKFLLKKTLVNVSNSLGLCYFMLENLADEIVRCLADTYQLLNIEVGRFEIKANIIIFMYKQVISFTSSVKLDARLLRTFDQYVIKKFVEDILPNEAQLTQILVTLRLYQSLRKHATKADSAKCKALLNRWSKIIQDIHEECINGTYFPDSIVPVSDTIHLKPQFKLKKFNLE